MRKQKTWTVVLGVLVLVALATIAPVSNGDSSSSLLDKTHTATVTRADSGITTTLTFSVTTKAGKDYISVHGLSVNDSTDAVVTEYTFDLCDYTGPLTLSDDGTDITWKWAGPGTPVPPTKYSSMAPDTFALLQGSLSPPVIWIPIPLTNCKIQIVFNSGGGCWDIVVWCFDSQGNVGWTCGIRHCPDGWHCVGTCCSGTN